MSRFKSVPAFSLFSRRPAVWLMLGIMVLLGVACGAAPVQEMSEARQAIEAARVAGAEQYAGERFERARSLLETAQQMLNDRRFRDARRSAAQARDEAILAREAAQQVLNR
jgi:hypothetical protein